jgi:hypothetical protein
MLNKTIDFLLQTFILAFFPKEIYVQTEDLKVNNGSHLNQPLVGRNL